MPQGRSGRDDDDGSRGDERPMTFRRSLAWTSTQFVAVVAIELAGLAVIARLVTPEEMGWFAAALAVVQFASFLGALELHTVIVRAERVDEPFRRRAIALALSASAAVVVALLGLVALPAADLLGEVPRRLLLVMLPVVLAGCYTMSAHALLVRGKRFRAVFFLKLASTLAYLAVAIPLAVGGAGAHALALGLLSSTLVHAVLSGVATRGAFWVRPSFRGSRETMRVAGTILGISVAHHASLGAVPLLIGRLTGFAPLGSFSRAEDIVRQGRRMLEDTVLPVVLPFVFDASRDASLRAAALRETYPAATANLTAVVWPGVATLMVLAEPFVRALLGPQWQEVPWILQLLAFGFLFHPLAAVSYIYDVALRREAILARFSVALAVVTVALTAVLASIGLAAVCWGLVAVQIAHAVFRVGLALHGLSLGVGAFLRSLAPSLLLALATGLSVLVSATQTGARGAPEAAVVLVSGAVGVVAWLAALFLLGHPLAREIARLAGAARQRS